MSLAVLTAMALAPPIVAALWMVLAPQLPAFRSRRGLLGALTWLATRVPLLLALDERASGALEPARAAIDWLVRLPGSMGVSSGDPAGTGAYAMVNAPWRDSLALTPGALLFVLAADLVAWRAIASTDCGTGEAAWGWVASPLVILLGVWSGDPRWAAFAFVALGFACEARGRQLLAGIAFGVTAAFAGPAGALLAAGTLLAREGRGARLAGALAGAAGAFALLRWVPGAWTAPWMPFARAGGGPGFWRLAGQFSSWQPGAWAVAPCVVVLLAGWARLAARGANARALATWAFGAGVLLAPGATWGWPVLFAPALVTWAADDPDRRGWWISYAALLPLAARLELGPEHARLLSPGGFVALAALGAVAALAAWPLRELWRAPGPHAAEVSPPAA